MGFRFRFNKTNPVNEWITIYGYGSIPIDTIFSGLFTSINPSYFDVNRRGTRVLTHPHITRVLDDGKIYRKALYLMVKTHGFPVKIFPTKPIQ